MQRLFVGNVAYKATEQELREVFERAGVKPTDVKIVTDRQTGNPRGFAFVEVEDGDAERAREVTGVELQGRPLRVDSAHERSDRGGGHGRGGGGRRR